MSVFQKPYWERGGIMWILVLIGAVLPLFGLGAYSLRLLSMVAIGATVALGLQLLLGLSGQLSIGQAAFYGIGAYTSGLLTTRAGWPFIAGFACAGLAAAGASLLMVPITRLRGAYLAVATLGFSIVVYLILQNEDWLTGGAFGLMHIPRPSLAGVELRSPAAGYYLDLGVFVVAAFAVLRLQDSRFGRAVSAVRQDEFAAAACGIGLTRYKSQCFVIAALISGLAGSLYAHQTRYLTPNDFDVSKSIEILIMAVIGGLAGPEGALLGALVVVLLPEYLQALNDYRMLIFGLLLIAIMLSGRGGLSGLLRRAVSRVSRPRLSAGSSS